MIIQGFEGSQASGQVRYLNVGLSPGALPATSESIVEYLSTRPGLIQNVRGTVGLNTLDGPTVLTFRLDGIDTALTHTIPSAFTGAFFVADVLAVANAKKVTIESDTTGAGVGSIRFVSVSFDFK